jgi:hypothetical protein
VDTASACEVIAMHAVYRGHLMWPIVAMVAVAAATEASVPADVSAARPLVGEATDAYDGFGAAVAASGSKLIVGARGCDVGAFNAGCAHVFTDDQGVWIEQPRVFDVDLQSSAQFGHAAVLDDTWLMVSAPRWDSASASDAGKINVYRWDLGLEVPVAQLTGVGGGESGARFGSTLAMAGDWLAVGSPGLAEVDLFRMDGVTWVHVMTLVSPDTSGDDDFGSALAISSQWLVVGAPGDDAGGINAGAAHVYARVGDSWEYDGRLDDASVVADDQYGCSLALDGSDLLIGVYRSDVASIDGGAVFRYHYLAGSWFAAELLLPEPSSPGMEFGTSVALDDDWMVIGAPSDGSDAARSGSVHLVPRSDEVSPMRLRMGVGEADGLELMGTSVAMSDHCIVAGLPLQSEVGEYSGGVSWIDRTADCDMDGTPDFISTALESVVDCDVDGVPDACVLSEETDCDDSGVLDSCEIADGSLPDTNGDGIPDPCQCPADMNGNGSVGVFEVLNIIANWGEDDPVADVDGSGEVGTDDLLMVIGQWGPCEL